VCLEIADECGRSTVKNSLAVLSNIMEQAVVPTTMPSRVRAATTVPSSLHHLVASPLSSVARLCDFIEDRESAGEARSRTKDRRPQPLPARLQGIDRLSGLRLVVLGVAVLIGSLVVVFDRWTAWPPYGAAKMLEFFRLTVRGEPVGIQGRASYDEAFRHADAGCEKMDSPADLLTASRALNSSKIEAAW